MRIYSSVLLSWPQVIHVFSAARLTPGVGRTHYNFYHINRLNPINITSYSPLKLLEENRQYYCYHHYLRDVKNESTNMLLQNITIYDPKSKTNRHSHIYIPKYINYNDYIVIKNIETPIDSAPIKNKETHNNYDVPTYLLF